MDGTLLNSEGELSDGNKRALIEVMKKGSIVAITTGRVHKYVKGFCRIHGFLGPIIASNGACVSLNYKEEPFYSAVMEYKKLLKIYEVAKQYAIDLFFTTPEGILFDQPLPEGHIYERINKTVAPEDRMKLEYVEDCRTVLKEYSNRIIKALCMDAKGHQNLATIRCLLEQEGGYEIVSSWCDNIEIMPEGVSKGKGVEMLAKKLNIPLTEVMAIGDSENDLSMIKIAGLGVAMGNASHQVKEVADDVTCHHNQDGVAQVLGKFIL